MKEDTMISKNFEQLKSEVEAHVLADAVISGTYWNKDDDLEMGGSGCFIGCLSHSNDSEVLLERFGFPIPLVHLLEQIFEQLSWTNNGWAESKTKKASVDFFRDIPDAIERDGKDLSKVFWKFLAWKFETVTLDTDIDNLISGFISNPSRNLEDLKTLKDAYIENGPIMSNQTRMINLLGAVSGPIMSGFLENRIFDMLENYPKSYEESAEKVLQLIKDA